MVRTNDPFGNYVKDMNDGSMKCKFCGHKFASDTSISRIKWHLSGERGHGVSICGQVPKEVQEAAFLAMCDGNKRHKSIPSSRNVNDLAGDAGRMQVGVQGWRERIHSHVDKENTVTQGTNVVDQFADGTWDQIHSALSMAPKLNEITTYLMQEEEDVEHLHGAFERIPRTEQVQHLERGRSYFLALALSPSHSGSHPGLWPPNGTPEVHTLARWICESYRCYLGVKLFENEGSDSILKTLWHHSDALMCCSLKAQPVFTFANQAGLDMLETAMVALQDITLEKIFDDNGRKTLCSEFPLLMQQGFMCLQGGICLSSMGTQVSYERAVAWRVLNEEEIAHCICFMFINWSFV